MKNSSRLAVLIGLGFCAIGLDASLAGRAHAQFFYSPPRRSWDSRRSISTRCRG